MLPLLRRALPAGLELEVFGEEPHPGVDVRPVQRAAFLAALGRCRAVVASAGSQLISECVALGRPLFAVFDPAHDEQRLNVGMLEAGRLGAGCPADELDERRLADFLTAAPGRFVRSTWQGPDAAAVVLDRAMALAAAGR